MKEALTKFEEFGNLKYSKLQKAEEELHSLDSKAENNSITDEEKGSRRELKNEMWRLGRIVERMWHQKSRVNWYLKVDISTKYFHTMASHRQQRNSLNSINVLGEPIMDPTWIKQADFTHFKKLYQETWANRPSFLERIGNGLSVELAQQLETDFDIQEVWQALKTGDGNKAPGPDGFNLLSIKKGWKFMKADIMNFFTEFHKNCRLPKGFNSSFIVLVPKTENPQMFQ